MTLYDSMPRFVTKNPLVSFAMLLFSSVWFTMSVMALGYSFVTKRKRLPAQRAATNAIFILAPTQQSAEEAAQLPRSMLIPGDANYHVSFANLPLPAQRRLRRGPPAMITVVPPEYGSITITTSPDGPPTMSVTTTSAPPPGVDAVPAAPKEEVQDAQPTPDESDLPEEAAPEPDQQSLQASSSCGVRKSRLGSVKMPKVFRRKSRRVASDPCEAEETSGSRAATPENLTPSASPLQRLAELFPDDGRESIPLEQRKSYHKAEDDGEYIRTRFVNPLRFKPKRAQTLNPNGSPSRNSAELSRDATSSPPPPSSFTSPQHKRTRSLASVVGSVIRSHSHSRGNSPHRGSFSSCSTASSTASSATSSSASSSTSATSYCTSSSSKRSRRSSVSERDVPRTQPYGAPYFAAMPVPRTRARRASVTSSKPVVSESPVQRPQLVHTAPIMTRSHPRREHGSDTERCDTPLAESVPVAVAARSTGVDELGYITASTAASHRHVEGATAAVR